MMKTQNVNVSTDMFTPNVDSEELETKSLPKYLEDSVLQKRNKLATWSNANSLWHPMFESRMLADELFDRNALESDWAISSDDLVETIEKLQKEQVALVEILNESRNATRQSLENIIARLEREKEET